MTDYSKMTDDELSAAVAEKVMGWKKVHEDYVGERWAEGKTAGTRVPVPMYASSWQHAGEVVEKMREMGYHWRFTLLPTRNNRNGVGCAKWPDGDFATGYTDADDVPRAISLAALAATEGASNGE